MVSSCLRSHCCPDHTPTLLRSVAPTPLRPPRCQDVRPPVVGQRDRPTASGRPGSWSPLPLGSFVASLALRLTPVRRADRLPSPLLFLGVSGANTGGLGGIPGTWSRPAACGASPAPVPTPTAQVNAGLMSLDRGGGPMQPMM
jgi:hypothetical protein